MVNKDPLLALKEADEWIAATEARLGQQPMLIDTSERPWRKHARPDQLAPSEGEWKHQWYVRGARRSGKTWTGSNQFADLILSHGPNEWAIIAPTFGDARDTCVESMRSGLLKALTAMPGSGGQLRTKGPYIRDWNRSLGQLYLNNGSVVFCDGANDGALRIQGKGLAGAWLDEVGLFQKWRTAYDESIRYAVSSPPAKLIITGTPKFNMPARALVKRLIEDPNVAKSWLRLNDNRDNLESAVVDELMAMANTKLGRQETLGELLDTSDGALWNWETLERCHLTAMPSEVRPIRVVVAIDPAVSVSDDSDETGIIVACKGSDERGYVLEDLSGRYSPDQWARKAVDAYHRWQADLVIGEVNNGGDMIGHTVKVITADVAYRSTRATRGKVLRAEPIATAYEQGRVFHVGTFDLLEQQMTQCRPGEEQEHDDRLDAMVWALTELGLVGAGMSWTDVYEASTSEVRSEAVEINPWADAYE